MNWIGFPPYPVLRTVRRVLKRFALLKTKSAYGVTNPKAFVNECRYNNTAVVPGTTFQHHTTG